MPFFKEKGIDSYAESNPKNNLNDIGSASHADKAFSKAKRLSIVNDKSIYTFVRLLRRICVTQ